MKRIICIGNRYIDADAAGARVHDLLAERALPGDVELVDGGIGGLLLLDRVESATSVVFVDAVEGFAPCGHVVVLDAPTAAAGAVGRLDHSAGLAYLLRALPLVCDGPLPQIHVVGIEGPADASAIAHAAQLALDLAAGTAGPL